MIYPMLNRKNDTPPYGIRCPCNPHARASSHLGQWQSSFFRGDFHATPGAASPNGINGDLSARQRAYAEFGPDAHLSQRASSFAPRRYGPKASGVSCSAEYRDGPGTPSQMLGRQHPQNRVHLNRSAISQQVHSIPDAPNGFGDIDLLGSCKLSRASS